MGSGKRWDTAGKVCEKEGRCAFRLMFHVHVVLKGFGQLRAVKPLKGKYMFRRLVI